MKIFPFSSNKGFTLIEILIAVAIIGGMSAIILTASGNSGAKSQATADKASLVALQAAVDRFVNDYGSIPAYWDATNGTGKVLSTTENLALVQTMAGLTTGDTAVDAFSAKNSTLSLTETAALTATRFRAAVSTTTTPRVVVLQYRKGSSGYVVNGDNTVSSSFVAAATAVSSTTPFTALGTTTAWPY